MLHPGATLILSAAAALAAAPLAHSQTLDLVAAGGETHLVLGTRSGLVQLFTSTETVHDATLHPVPGSPALGVSWREGADPAAARAWYALSLDGERFSEPRTTSYALELRHGAFDPLAADTFVSPLAAAGPVNRLFIVQYATPGIEPYRDALRALGAEPRLFLARNANVVTADPEALELVRELPFVRWVGPFHPAYKLEERLLAEQVLGARGVLSERGTQRVNVLTLVRGGHAPVVERIEAMGGTVDSLSPETHLLTATLTRAQIGELARMDEVQWIDRWSAPEDDMDIARAFHGADYVESVAGYTGAGVRVEVMDGGCDEIHPDLQNFALHGSNTTSSHGTACSGIVAGSGAGNFAARGGVPDAFLAIADYDFLSNRYNHTAELQDPARVFRAVLQSNSWGNARTTSYTSISQNMDLILFDHSRISILQSQSNAGNQDSRPQAWAKNIIAVGGIRHFNTQTKSDDAWNFGASIGPAADGRIKPDLASFYDSTLCTDRVGTAGYASGNYYSSFGGTSGATPIVAGHLGLMYEMWADGLFGNAAPGATVFDDRPFNTTAKALLINTATQWTFSGTGHDLTRVHQGWGHPDLVTAYDRRNETYVVDESDVLVELGSTTHTLTVAAATPELKATMVYRDPPGTTSSSLHRINDLDLKVTAPGGAVYWGNNGLLASMYSTAGGSPNGVDTVENVFVQNPAAGTWLVEVIAAEINQDSHVETGAVDADYALVVTGATAGPPQPPTAGFSGSPTSGDAPLVVSFTDQSTGQVTAWNWDFGDTGTSSAQHPAHTYTSAGSYTVTLIASGPGGSDPETKVGYVTVTVPQPPAAPTGLSASPISSSRIDLAWTDNAGNEDDFEIERSPDGASWAQIATVGADTTAYSDTGLVASTTYHYRVRASNGAGTSAYSNTAMATTTSGATIDDVANGEVSVAGSVSGSFTATQSANDAYQSVTERESGGKPANRYSYLEHKWTFSVTGGTQVTLHAQAHHSVSPDGDDFVLAWSTDDVNYFDAITVTKTTDDGTYQTAALPSSISGTLFVRARDTDQTSGNRDLDTLFVDHVFVRSQGAGGGLPPNAPTNLVATATSSSRIDVTWLDASSNETSFELERSPAGASWSLLATLGADTTSYSDTGLAASTTRHYRVRAVNAAGASGYSNADSATTFGAGVTNDVANGESAVSGRVTGSFVDTQANDLVYQSVRERKSGGSPSSRYSFLEHQWTFQVTGGSTVSLHVKAYHSPSTEDDFVISYSTNGTSFTDALTVTRTVDDGTYQVANLPSSLSGNVWIRVLDTDQTPGNSALDTFYVDHIFIRSE